MHPARSGIKPVAGSRGPAESIGRRTVAADPGEIGTRYGPQASGYAVPDRILAETADVLSVRYSETCAKCRTED
jgi:hypothetical protein